MIDDKVLKFLHRRFFIFLSFKILLFIILISRLFYLQIIKSRYFLEKSNNNSLKKVSIPSRRGFIFDSNNRLLAGSVQVYSVLLNLDKIQNIENFIKKYQDILDFSSEEKKFLEKS